MNGLCFWMSHEILMRYGCAFSFQAEEGSDEVYCQVLLVPESEVRLILDFTLVYFGFWGKLAGRKMSQFSTCQCLSLKGQHKL